MLNIEAMKALCEPSRCRILMLLSQRAYCVSALATLLNISTPAASQHLRILRDAGLVTCEKYGYHTHYLPQQEAVDYLADQFEKMRIASLRVDRDMTQCQCEYRKENQEK